jgi:hypothetical protein
VQLKTTIDYSERYLRQCGVAGIESKGLKDECYDDDSEIFLSHIESRGTGLNMMRAEMMRVLLTLGTSRHSMHF